MHGPKRPDEKGFADLPEKDLTSGELREISVLLRCNSRG
jgi:hypothetical protein